MKQIFKVAIFIIAIPLLFTVYGCSKSGEPIANFTKTQLLTNSDWVQTGKQSKLTTSTVWTDNFTSTSACSKDDRLVFRVNGIFELNEGPTKCNSSDPQIQATGTWSFAQNETKLVINIAGLSGSSVTIESLTATLLVITYTDSWGGITNELKETYSH